MTYLRGHGAGRGLSLEGPLSKLSVSCTSTQSDEENIVFWHNILVQKKIFHPFFLPLFFPWFLRCYTFLPYFKILLLFFLSLPKHHLHQSFKFNYFSPLHSHGAMLTTSITSSFLVVMKHLSFPLFPNFSPMCPKAYLTFPLDIP